MPQETEMARLQAVVDTAVDGVILIDAQGVVLTFNPACEKLFGYAADEAIGQNVKMLMPEPYRGEHDGYLQNYRSSGDAKIIGIGREVTGRRKDGTTFPMDLSVGESKEEGPGRSIFVGIIRDLTERKRAEQALRASAAQIAAVVNTAVDGVILIDAGGTVQMFNPACERLFGYRADEVMGQNVKMLMPPPFRQEHDRYLESYNETRVPRIIGIGREVVGRRKDGTTFPMDLSVGEARQEDKSIFVGIIHDLSDRKRTEEQLIQAQKMEAVGQLSGGIAHDFNNLLTVIIGNADLLSHSLKARPDLKSLAETIVAAGGRGAELTQRLLAFGRRQVLVPTEINGNDLINSMRAMLTRTLREDIEIRIQLMDDLWPAFADPGQLENAILNLAINARDAMPDGGSLTVTTSNVSLDSAYHHGHPEVKPGHYVMVSVTDDGQGMPPDVLERVFEPFFTTKEVGKGSGLGLSMVYGFVKQSNGHVTIYSEPGLGTTVRIYLPASGSAPAASNVAEPASVDPAAIARGAMVLVAEDDMFVRAYAVTTLKSLGYRVIEASDGPDALAKLQQGQPPDILFSDIVMPGGVSGFDLAERARELVPGIKVLLTSGYALETLAARGRMVRNVVVMTKPYRKQDLAQKLREAIEMPDADRVR
jgi:PAS domain S-box-containing protein